MLRCRPKVVSNGSKILNWKQITTSRILSIRENGCVQWFKDTKLKANHNNLAYCLGTFHVVSNGSKILNWKQITTLVLQPFGITRCVQWFKDTKLKANHNEGVRRMQSSRVVSNGSKILNWKQITTVWCRVYRLLGCVQWFKDTKLKANHNSDIFIILIL